MSRSPFQWLCIFCRGHGDMTDEHVWGKWLKPHLRTDINRHHLQRRIVSRDGTHGVTMRPRTGRPLSSTIGNVCKRCNTGWLSAIQKAAKTHMEPVFLGKDSNLGETAQLAIARWATMAAMTGEFSLNNIASVGVSQNERSVFMSTLNPPSGWRIWIGKYRRTRWEGNWVHASMPIEFEGTTWIIPNIQEPNVPLSNTQWTTVMVGELYIHAASSSSSPDFIMSWDWRNAVRARWLLAQIWPMKEKWIKWPFTAGLLDRDAQTFSTAQFFHLDARYRARTATLPIR